MTLQRSTFYQQEASNRRRSLLLVLIVALLFAALGFAIGYAYSGYAEGGFVAMLIALFIAVLLTAGSYFEGDSVVLAASSAKEVTAEQAPQLYNVVTELAIAANVPVPKVYIIDDTAPNAFATGRDPKHASVAITTGLLEKLDREELQGVIGHELSHVRNYDIRFTLLGGALVGGTALVAGFSLRFPVGGGMCGAGRRSRASGGGGGGG